MCSNGHGTTMGQLSLYRPSRSGTHESYKIPRRQRQNKRRMGRTAACLCLHVGNLRMTLRLEVWANTRFLRNTPLTVVVGRHWVLTIQPRPNAQCVAPECARRARIPWVDPLTLNKFRRFLYISGGWWGNQRNEVHLGASR